MVRRFATQGFSCLAKRQRSLLETASASIVQVQAFQGRPKGRWVLVRYRPTPTDPYILEVVGDGGQGLRLPLSFQACFESAEHLGVIAAVAFTRLAVFVRHLPKAVLGILPQQFVNLVPPQGS